MTAPLTDTVTMTITEDTVGVSRLGFGTALFLSYTAAFAERVRTYNSLADVAVDFPTTTSVEYLAAQIHFSQTPKPKQMKIGRGALGPTAVYTMSLSPAPAVGTEYAVTVKGDGVTSTSFTVTALADVTVSSVANATETFSTASAHGMTTGDGPYRLTNSGGGLPAGTAVDTNYWIINTGATTFQLAASYADAIALTPVAITTDGTGTHTVQRDANDVIVAQIVDRLNSVAGNNYLAAQVTGAGDTDTWTVTSDAAGEWFSLDVDHTKVVSALTHADPGVATDLIAINLYDADWYVLLTPAAFNSNAYTLAAAAWIEANTKMYWPDLVNSLSITGTVLGAGNDIADNLHTLAYKRTAPFYSDGAADMPAVGASGRFLPTTPGAAIVKFKRIAGVTPSSLTATHRGNLRAKRCNWLETSGGLNIVFDGFVSAEGGSGWIDVTRDLDYVKDDLQVRIFTGLVSAEKVGHDDDGYAVIEAELRAGLDNAVALGIFLPGYTIEIPLRADVSDSDLADRHLPNVKWSATLRGAVQTVDVQGTVSL